MSVTGLLSNMLLVPLASWVMGVTFLFYVCTLFKIGFLLKSITFASLWLFERLVEFFAGFTLSSVGTAAWDAGTVAAYYCVLCWVFHLPLKNAARKTAPWLLGAACILLAGQYVYTRAVRVWMFNEWNHSAVIVRTCRGKTFLFGAGMKGDKLARAVRAVGARKIDAVFLTDTSAKAGKGLEELSALLPVAKVIRPYAQGVWPGDRVPVGRAEASVEWPAFAAKDEDRVWREKGFSGKEDAVSYRLHACGEELLIGAGQRFVQTPHRLKRPPRNGYLFWRV